VNQTFGYAVAVGANGSTVVIVANLPDESGMLYVYNCSASGQCQLASNITDDNPVAGDLFGYGIFMDDDMLIVGAPGKNNETGAAYLFDCSDSTSCSLETQLVANGSVMGDFYGQLTGLEDWLAVVGAGHQNNYQGAAYVFDCSDTSNCVLLSVLTAPAGSVTGGYFGAFLYVANQIVYVTAAFNDSTTGYAWGFNCSDRQNGCGQAYAVQPTDLDVGDEYGAFIVAYDSTVVVSAQYHNDEAGGAYVFDCSDVTNCMQTAYLNASDASPGDTFSWVLAITEQMIISTAPFKNNNTGEYYTYVNQDTAV
jgi:hypothetical protein